ncbi:MAG TPA: type II toxin-antitoxin system VapC family toxin [Caulobacteraceae bacterium]|jgi:ribonuclease VapC
MHVDASAIVAITTREPEHAELIARLDRAPSRSTSPLSLYEASLGIARKLDWSQTEARRLVAMFLAQADIEVIAIDQPVWVAAIEAFERFGRGRHPAGLNMGDCFAYACAKTRGEPLLFKGNDFPLTDVAVA